MPLLLALLILASGFACRIIPAAAKEDISGVEIISYKATDRVKNTGNVIAIALDGPVIIAETSITDENDPGILYRTLSGNQNKAAFSTCG